MAGRWNHTCFFEQCFRYCLLVQSFAFAESAKIELRETVANAEETSGRG